MAIQPGDSISDKNLTTEGPRSVLQDMAARQRNRRRRIVLPAWPRRLIDRLRPVFIHRISDWFRSHRQTLMTAFTSGVIHLLLALLLALWVLPSGTTDQIISLLAVRVSEEEGVALELAEIVQPDSLDDLKNDNTIQKVLEVIDDTTTDLAAMDTGQDRELDLQPTEQDLVSLAKLGEFGGRSSFGKQAAIKKYGGTTESEGAVNAGLKWLKKIQRRDGSWSFGSPGEGAEPGRLRSTDMGSTSLALLSFLGAGHTHRGYGQYQETVADGVKYLMKSAQEDRTSADLRGDFQGDSGMYVQGLATICVCEASALEPSDMKLKRLARKAIRFIEKTQDKKGGGWRYEPGEKGDTSVVGWQVMALQSAKTGDIAVSRQTGRRVKKFLDSVQTNDGSRYGYLPRRAATPSMTSVGLLCRMYMGWRRNQSSLGDGVGYLTAMGPHSEDMYYNYYATQVIHHWGGKEWQKWNAVMRDQLVSRQITNGPAAGSWSPRDPHAYSGGQIYETTLCLLTLEIYYRHLPIYRQLEDSVE
jgi:hypothetical protein